MIDAEDLLTRFLSYVQVDTRSDPHSQTTPSTPKQWVLVRQLEHELRDLGLQDVTVSEYGYVLATVPSTTSKKSVPRVALLAHLDTAQGCSGLARPIVHRNYRGQPIVLPAAPDQVLTVENEAGLKDKLGQDVITASGDSLLGADDKAGVAAIMAAARHLVRHPELRHGSVRICFNPDEEIGRGSEKITLEELAADVAYTFDADDVGIVDYETFSADKAVLRIHGVAAHPGWAKGLMVNAIKLGSKFIDALPKEKSPEHTSDRDGFIHPDEMTGGAADVEIMMLLRDFEVEGLAAKRKLIEDIIERLKAEEPRARFELEVTQQYRNMRYWLQKDFRPVDYALEAVRRAGFEPRSQAVRGGTDGSRLTERGLPTPNIFCGFHDVHSPREWITLQDMTKAAETAVHLVCTWEEKS
ncbi:MAG: peptidase T [Deltaproteobacteria bacterium]|nr:peptidase T [Deltaproteobacteria bacterium]